MYRKERHVKSRKYDSSRRREQARQTRRAVLDAARRLFLDRGYAETTLPAVAAAAGVSVETIYKGFANKTGLLKAVFDVAIVGDDEPIPMLERDLVRRIRAEPDPRRKLAIYGEHLSEAGPRASALQLLMRGAAVSDREAARMWDQMLTERLTGMTHFARELHEGGHLRTDMSIEDATDILFTYNSVELYDLLVIQREWTNERYGRFIADALIGALLPQPD
ncbi:MAG: TetR/AcrR family transcriptional regulator [Actinomycetota bacterium]|nr:TetR/AcrR family transcriptional regulator [Actinomycetota bacterium]